MHFDIALRPPSALGDLMKSALALYFLWAVSFATRVGATPAQAQFVLESSSFLELDASLLGFNDVVRQELAGSLNLLLDFGSSGALSDSIRVSIIDGAVNPAASYEFALTLNNVAIEEASATLTSVAPSLEAMRGTPSSAVYEFDASAWDFSINQGTLTSTGFVAALIDLAECPLVGSLQPGADATLEINSLTTGSPYSSVDATLILPIAFSTVADLNGDELELIGTGQIVARASFVAALLPVPGDFDDDLSVTGDDLLVWIAGFGSDLATRLTGDANEDNAVDGADVLIWQQNFGLSPPQVGGSATIPEPASGLSYALLLMAEFSRRALRQAGGGRSMERRVEGSRGHFRKWRG